MIRVIGLTGTNGSGKDTVAKFLVSRGFILISLSDILREELRKMDVPETRENLVNLGNIMRQAQGSGVLAERARRMIGNGNYVINSIRNPHEIVELKKIPNFYLIAMDAPVEERFNRIVKRGRIENASALGEFIAGEQREFSNESHKQSLGKCMLMSDRLIMNDSTIYDLHSKIEKMISGRDFYEFIHEEEY